MNTEEKFCGDLGVPTMTSGQHVLEHDNLAVRWTAGWGRVDLTFITDDGDSSPLDVVMSVGRDDSAVMVWQKHMARKGLRPSMVGPIVRTVAAASRAVDERPVSIDPPEGPEGWEHFLESLSTLAEEGARNGVVVQLTRLLGEGWRYEVREDGSLFLETRQWNWALIRAQDFEELEGHLKDLKEAPSWRELSYRLQRLLFPFVSVSAREIRDTLARLRDLGGLRPPGDRRH